ncbi:MAG: hypothetical protein P4L33_17105 [Capsulimonadaceae bacterium]|nr:hypothetical protein [Capsulimonadaceae bacterium]
MIDQDKNLRRGNEAVVARRRSQQGQSLLIALAVLIILSFLGTIFVAIVGHNLLSAQQSNRTSSADTYAQAGIDFADKMLQVSPEGADWRPPLQYNTTSPEVCTWLTAALSTDPDKTYLSAGYTRYNVGAGRFLLRVSYLNETGDASENPAPNTGAPQQTTTSKFLKIESVGLEGTVNPDDPTLVNVATSRPSTRTAYKPICLGDYSRFITNRFNRTDAACLGFPSVWGLLPGSASTASSTLYTPGVESVSLTSGGSAVNLALQSMPITFGSANAYTGTNSNATLGGGAIRANTDLRLYGVLNVYLNPRYGEDIETSGRLLFDGFNQGANGTADDRSQQPTQLIVTRPNLDTTQAPAAAYLYPTNAVLPSSGAGLFSTDQGAVRDGIDGSDNALYDNSNAYGGTDIDAASGYPRNVKRRNPPVIDQTDPQTQLSRYAALAQIGSTGALGGGTSSSTSSTSSSSSSSTAVAGYSGPFKSSGSLATIFVDNSADLQAESEQFTMRDQWINRADPQKAGYWRGPIYTPPGALVTFGMVPGTKQWGVTIVRSDISASGSTIWSWNNDNNGISSLAANRMRFVYAASATDQDGNATNGTASDPIYALNADNAPSTACSTTNPPQDNANNDVLIYTEGNVRVRGVISQPGDNGSGSPNNSHHITLVTNGIAYIDGCILKGNYASSTGGALSLGSEFGGSTTPVSTSSIAILARQYVCVNTTQFFPGTEEPQANLNAATIPPALIDSGWEFRSGQSLTMSVLYPKLYYATSSAANTVTPEKLYISASGEPTDAYGQVSIADPYNDVLRGSATPSQDPLFPGNDTTSIPEVPSPSNGIRDTSTLLPTSYSGALTGMTYGYGLEPFVLNFSADQARSAANWLVRRAAVLPGDIRIEAMLYAQDNSFFVIPGDWFNPDTSDTVDNFLSRNWTTGTGTTDKDFPAYGQPVDLKITIYGSVSENLPADIADQQAWMQKWGWIPQYHGADCYTGTSLPSPHYATGGVNGVAPGLTFQYDPLEGFPILGVGAEGGVASTTTSAQYIRVDRFGRPLPFVPNLPVSPDLVYSGLPS